MGGMFRTPKVDTSAQQAELARQNELVEQTRLQKEAEKLKLDAQEAARNRALTGAMRGRAALLGSDEEGVASAEARGNVVPMKQRLGQ